MIRLAKLTDYGLVLMTIIARDHASSTHTARDLAAQSRLPLPTVSKVLKLLLQSGMLVSHRGIKGGYSLAKEPAEISLAEIITAIEGPIALTECSTDITGLCDLERSCPIKRNQRVISQVVRGALDRVTLFDLIQPMQLTAIKGAHGKLVPHDWLFIRESSMSSNTDVIRDLAQQEYKWGFVTNIEEERIPKGLNEDIIRLISAKKNEPQFMLDWRLKAYRYWATQEAKDAEPKWANVHYPPIDYQAITYYSAPKQKPQIESLDQLDPEILRTYEKLGIPITEQKMLAGVAVDAVFDSVSVATTFKAKLSEYGVIFCSFSDAVKNHPELVQKYLGSVVPYTDNFFAALNAAVFSDGSFVYVPKGVRCPMELSTYFRINAAETGQFERTLIVADEGAYVSYLEGCTAPIRDENQLHAAVVELVALDNATIKYSTVQNWYPGDKNGKGGIYNFVTKRGKCQGVNSKISWTQVETGSAITWKYPGCILQGDNSVGEFYSVALTNNYQQADTGTKMIHIGKNTKSTVVSKGISAGRGQNTYRGLVKILKGATGARNYTQCDSLLIGDKCGAHTFPYIEVKNSTAQMEHEASTSKIGEDQLFYLRQRGLKAEDAVSMIVNGFCKRVFRELPMEFAVEAQKLLSVSLEGSVG